MRQIKTIITPGRVTAFILSPKDYAAPVASFDQLVNSHLAKGWTLVKRETYVVDNDLIFCAELEKEEKPSCSTCKHRDDPRAVGVTCELCSIGGANLWAPAE